MCSLYYAVFFIPLTPNKCPLGLVVPSEVAGMEALEELRRKSLEGPCVPGRDKPWLSLGPWTRLPSARSSPRGRPLGPHREEAPPTRSRFRTSAERRREPASLFRAPHVVQGSDKGLSFLFSLVTTGIILRREGGRKERLNNRPGL